MSILCAKSRICGVSRRVFSSAIGLLALSGLFSGILAISAQSAAAAQAGAAAQPAITAQSSAAATVTSLEILAGGTAVSTVNAGTVVELRSSTTVNGVAVTGGTVRFCDASASYCTGTHLLATVPVTAQGQASFRFRPGAGDRDYKAVFSALATRLASTSNATFLSVTKAQSTSTTLSSIGMAGNYTLTSTVSSTSLGSAATLSGQSVSFVDQTNGNAVLATVQLPQPQISVTFNGSSLTAGTEPQDVAVGDFNGDGIPDIAIANSALNVGNPNTSPHGTVNIYLGKGDGTFTQAPNSPITVGLDTRNVGVMDLNGDGIQDLVVLNAYSQNVFVLLGVGDGSFTAAPGSPFLGGGNTNPYSVAFADFNGDGKMDMAVAGWGAQAPNNKGAISIFLGNGDGTFQAPLLAPVGVFSLVATSVVTADFNGDGIPDLALARPTDDEVSILLGNGDGTFQEAASSPIAFPSNSQPYVLITSDFNADGIPDLAVKQLGTGIVSVLLGTSAGDGSFAQPDTSNVSGPDFQANYSLAVGDLNGDGLPDIVQAGYNADLGVFAGNGDGTFVKVANTADPGNSPYSLAVGDFNGDGIDDLVAADYGGNNATVLSTIAVLQSSASATKISPLGTGTHKVFAQFAAVGNFAGSASPTIDLIASPGAPSITVTPSATTIHTTDALSVTVKLSGGPANPAPSGTVKISSGTYASADVALANGSATFTIPGGSLAGGADLIAAAYTPDTAGTATYVASSANSSVITVSKVTPALTVSAASNSINTIDPIMVTVSLTDVPSPTGTVQLTSGSYSSSAATLSKGNVSVTIPAASLSAGSDTITATYTPDVASTPIYNAATATSSAITVSKVTPAISVKASAAVITDQQPLTLTATVGVSGQPVPGGSLTIVSGAYSTQANLVNGAATINVPAGALAAGADTVTVTYLGDPLYNTIAANAPVTVAPIVITASTPSAITAGGSGTATITLNAGSTYKGTANLTCTLTSSPSGAQSLPACSLNPTSLVFTAAGSATTTLTITTTAASASLQPGQGLPWRPAGAIAFGVLMLFGMPRRRKWAAWLVLLLAIGGAGAIGCGGGGSSNSGTKLPPIPSTTAGNYVFTVKATDSAVATTSASMDVSFTVQ